MTKVPLSHRRFAWVLVVLLEWGGLPASFTLQKRGEQMPRAWQERLQDLWVRSPRNRILMMVSAGVIAILLLCGACNLVGTTISGVVSALFTSNPGPKPTGAPNTSQINTFHPTFPIPTGQTYQYPNPPAQNAPSSGTPPPSPTNQHTQHDRGNQIHYQLSPDSHDFKAGTTNYILLNGGQPGEVVAVSILIPGLNTCIQGIAPGDPVVLDANGQGSFSCDIPANLRGASGGIQIQPQSGPPLVRQGIPVV